jgi:imidazolonepropionase-like amidohydrolase
MTLAVLWCALFVTSDPPPVTAFIDVHVVPMDSERVLEHQTVLVGNGRIIRIGPVRRITVPTGAVRIDGRGKYLMPGLTEMHHHGLRPEREKFTPARMRALVEATRQAGIWIAPTLQTMENMYSSSTNLNILRRLIKAFQDA